MALFIFLALIFLGFFLILGWYRWREGKFLKKKTKEAMGRGMRIEIERERQDALRRKKKFEDHLRKFQP